MQLTRFERAADFAARADEFLVAHEAHNNLLLGITANLREQAEPPALPPYFAVVEAAGQVVAAAVMTPPWRLVLARTEWPEALDLAARDVHEAWPNIPGVTGPVPVSLWFAERWSALTGQAARRSMAERIYQLRRVNPPQSVPGAARRAAETDRELLKAWIAAFEQEAFGEVVTEPETRADRFLRMPSRGMYLWEHEGQIVSLAGYGGPTPHGIRIGPVYTPPELRGRGYASACVARLSQDMLDGGRQYCFLYTDLANPTSNRIYQAIGYEPVCDVDEYRFEKPEGAPA
jgi:predicted GNAT family acetyltransferase